MRGRYGAILGLALLGAPGIAWAGAWTMDAGRGQVITTGTFSQANDAFDGSRNTVSIPRYRKIEIEPLLEYGVTDRLTLMFGPSFQHIDIAPPIDASRTGLGYTEFGGRFGIWRGDSWVFSGQTLVRVPGTSQTGNPAAIGYTNTEIDLRALLGKSFTLGNMPAFIDLQAAQRVRTGDPPSEFRFDATFGLWVAPQWLLLFQSFNVVSEGAGTGPFFPAYDYEKLQISVVYNFTPAWAVQLGAFTAFNGRNALQENALVTGLWYRF